MILFQLSTSFDLNFFESFIKFFSSEHNPIDLKGQSEHSGQPCSNLLSCLRVVRYKCDSHDFRFISDSVSAICFLIIRRSFELACDAMAWAVSVHDLFTWYFLTGRQGGFSNYNFLSNA